VFRQIHQVTLLEENVLQDFPPHLISPQQKFEIHPEMDKLLLLCMGHDLSGFLIRFDRYPLLIPVDGICSSIMDMISRANVRVSSGSSSNGS
jgi:hypothetical protein